MGSVLEAFPCLVFGFSRRASKMLKDLQSSNQINSQNQNAGHFFLVVSSWPFSKSCERKHNAITDV